MAFAASEDVAERRAPTSIHTRSSDSTQQPPVNLGSQQLPASEAFMDLSDDFYWICILWAEYAPSDFDRLSIINAPAFVCQGACGSNTNILHLYCQVITKSLQHHPSSDFETFAESDECRPLKGLDSFDETALFRLFETMSGETPWIAFDLINDSCEKRMATNESNFNLIRAELILFFDRMPEAMPPILNEREVSAEYVWKYLMMESLESCLTAVELFCLRLYIAPTSELSSCVDEHMKRGDYCTFKFFAGALFSAIQKLQREQFGRDDRSILVVQVDTDEEPILNRFMKVIRVRQRGEGSEDGQQRLEFNTADTKNKHLVFANVGENICLMAPVDAFQTRDSSSCTGTSFMKRILTTRRQRTRNERRPLLSKTANAQRETTHSILFEVMMIMYGLPSDSSLCVASCADNSSFKSTSLTDVAHCEVGRASIDAAFPSSREYNQVLGSFERHNAPLSADVHRLVLHFAGCVRVYGVYENDSCKDARVTLGECHSSPGFILTKYSCDARIYASHTEEDGSWCHCVSAAESNSRKIVKCMNQRGVVDLIHDEQMEAILQISEVCDSMRKFDGRFCVAEVDLALYQEEMYTKEMFVICPEILRNIGERGFNPAKNILVIVLVNCEMVVLLQIAKDPLRSSGQFREQVKLRLSNERDVRLKIFGLDDEVDDLEAYTKRDLFTEIPLNNTTTCDQCNIKALRTRFYHDGNRLRMCKSCLSKFIL